MIIGGGLNHQVNDSMLKSLMLVGGEEMSIEEEKTELIIEK